MGSVTPPEQREPCPLDGPKISPKDYARWRPSYHLIAPRGWMNDPCAPGYIPSTNSYHVGFQWNPKGAEWGDIVWGKAFSSDLVSWDVPESPSLKRDAPYDCEGVFTGCWRPTGLDGSQKGDKDGQGEVSFIYTSVSRLPIHYTKEYHRGCETLSVATSRDGGHTWTKHSSNPVLPGPPEDVAITGWRDPYVAPWPAVRKLVATRRPELELGGVDLAGEQEPLFGIISGGIRSETPATFLYKIDPADLTSWSYIAPLTTPGLNFAPSRWTGDLGVNWEVTNFLSLCSSDKQHNQDFLIFGAEGCQPPHGGPGVVAGSKRCPRAQLWIGIDPAEEGPSKHGALMDFSYGGVFDHGLYYAANGFFDPVTKRQVVIGWVTEDDLPVEMQVNQGWSGCLSLPRTVSLATINNVVRTSRSDLESVTSVKATPVPGHEGLFTVQTLAVAPEPRLQKLRSSALRRAAQRGKLGPETQTAQRALPVETARWEAQASFSSVSSSRRVGLAIRHGATEQPTRLYFAPADETFVIERPDFYVPPSFKGADGLDTKLQAEAAPFTLFTTRDAQTGAEAEENLTVHVFHDGSVLEVFVNDRAAITTRVYLEDARCSGLDFFADGAGAVLEEAVLWDGLSASA